MKTQSYQKSVNTNKIQVTSEELKELNRIIVRIKGEATGYTDTFLTDLHGIIVKNSKKAGGIIRILQQSQGLLGFLPDPLIRIIAREMRLPLSEVYGIVSFYHFFTMKPKGKHVIQVCMGTSCYVRGGQKLLDTLKKENNLKPGDITPDGKFSLELVRCLGACGISPVMAVGTDVQGRVKASKLHDILNSY
ncbi:MAG: NAD(P)H-dependent oxidoreductase subunit E [Chloroflexi bacterium]|nr:NAD(P)H-dependent oxidoreductase subunit E [Chloroflexota bacterium]